MTVESLSSGMELATNTEQPDSNTEEMESATSNINWESIFKISHKILDY